MIEGAATAALRTGLQERESFRAVSEALSEIEHEPDAYIKIANIIRFWDEWPDRSNNVYFIGNGGSAAIANHQAIDWAKNGRMRAYSLSDSAAITCLANDFGYEHAMARYLERMATRGDLLFAISSSGQSANILNAIDSATALDMHIVTMSGFHPENSLRGRGFANFYVPSSKYGTVEICHLAILHSILDEWIDAKGY